MLLRGFLTLAANMSLPTGASSPPPPAPTLFVCRASACVPADDGIPLNECAKVCLGPAPPSPPTCAEGAESSTLQLACPVGGVITGVTFAQYGLVSGACSSFTNTSCAADISRSVESVCIGRADCSVMCSHSCCPLARCCGCVITSANHTLHVKVPDPLPGASKTQAVQVICNNSLPDSRLSSSQTASPTSPSSLGAAENNVAYFSWYSYTGCGEGLFKEPGCVVSHFPPINN